MQTIEITQEKNSILPNDRPFESTSCVETAAAWQSSSLSLHTWNANVEQNCKFEYVNFANEANQKQHLSSVSSSESEDSSEDVRISSNAGSSSDSSGFSPDSSYNPRACRTRADRRMPKTRSQAQQLIQQNTRKIVNNWRLQLCTKFSSHIYFQTCNWHLLTCERDCAKNFPANVFASVIFWLISRHPGGWKT